ncbi:MAG: hypothetical protein L0I76_37670, partial [Pseudonocardia sp.]|nr:hypothetical protein [Pseudonocardia sp.]
MIDIDPLGCDTEPVQGFALRGEVLKIGAAPAIADQKLTHDRSVADSRPSPGIKWGRAYGNVQVMAELRKRTARERGGGRPVGVP